MPFPWVWRSFWSPRGITLIFGLLKILNMAQGAFFMIGAYLAFSIIGHQQLSLPAFIGVALLAGLAVGLLGLLTDRLILSRLRHVDYHYMLIATFALMMVCHGVVKVIWGVEFLFGIAAERVGSAPSDRHDFFIALFRFRDCRGAW